MSEFKDPKIKLFGKTIQVPDNSAAAAAAAAPEAGESVSGQSGEAAGEDSFNQDPSCTSDSVFEDSNFNRDAEEQQSREILSDTPKQEDHPKEESKDSIATQSIIDDPNEPSAEQDQSDSQQDKTPKKPDKIIPCPRCNSMETKFCYFNNYNVNQPRHFCKNCQRYWTAGGTMRNVPVGAGRRKNKNNVPQFRHLIVPEALPNGTHHPSLNPNNGTVLTFGSDSSAPLCESMSSVLNISKNGPHKPEEQNDGAACKTVPNYQLPTYPVAPLPYPWNPVQWTNHMPPPGMRFPVPFYSTGPPPYWACAVPGSHWSVPWVVPPPSSGPISPTLGKHSRDENVPEGADKTESKSEKCLWFPKTLRIDDPGEAAKSSIWATLGIKNDGVDSVVGGGLFESFVSQSKVEEKSDHVPETSAVLQANPAAFSRSVNFHETS